MISLTIIGSGNVAHHLIKAFSDSKNVSLKQIFCRKKTAEYDAFDVFITDNYEKMIETDVYIIAVSDHSIFEVSEQIPFENKLVVHTSGSNFMEGLGMNNRKGVFYPLQTFSKKRQLDFTQIPICIETENKTDLVILENLGKSLGSKTYYIDGQQRKALHVSAVFVNNFTNHLYKLGNDICIENNIPFEILLPLINETAEKLQDLEPQNAQTGPAKRQDFATISSHLKFLKHSDNKHLYETLTQSIIQNG